MKSYLKTGLFTTLMAFSVASPVWADNHEGHKDCTCTKECKENCKKGDTKDCKCENGACKTGGDCGDSCDKKHSDK